MNQNLFLTLFSYMSFIYKRSTCMKQEEMGSYLSVYGIYIFIFLKNLFKNLVLKISCIIIKIIKNNLLKLIFGLI